MNDATLLKQLRTIIDAEQHPLPGPALQMAQAIRHRHGDAVSALIFYGSALRDDDATGKMLDFYVLVKDYRSIYPNPLLRLATTLLPPGVHFLQIERPDGKTLRSKYAVMSERDFCRSLAGGFESMFWARFAQPARVDTADAEVREAILISFAQACVQFYRQTIPLVAEEESVWVRGLAESYRTELRPENPKQRAEDIVHRNRDRYIALDDIFRHGIETASDTRQFCALKWWLRRIIGKPRGVARILKAAATFDAGLDYILEKVGAHTDTDIQFSASVRRHPILYSPFIAWRLYRAGAFR